MTTQKPFPIPVNYFSMILGLSGLGLSWRYATHVFHIFPFIGESLLIASGMIWLLLILAYVYKAWTVPEQVKADLQNLVMCCFLSLIPITTMLMGMTVMPYSRFVAILLFAVAIPAQLLFSAYRVPGLWRGVHSQKATLPVVYLPAVAANFVTASSLGLMGYSDWGLIFWGAGVFSWLSLEPAILSRLRDLPEVEAKFRGLIGIQLAPAFVGCGAYLAVNGGHIDTVAKMLMGYGLLQLLYLIRLLPWIAQEGFNMSFWGFSFGLALWRDVPCVYMNKPTEKALEYWQYLCWFFLL